MDPNSEIENAQAFGGRATTKALTDTKITPVILVCIYNKNSTLITHDLLYNVFSAYGKILKILIFEKVKVWKAFIEFSNVDEAVEAKRMLNDFQIFSDGTRINVYFSQLENVKFQNNNSGGIDYTQTGAPNLSDFKSEFPLPVPEPTGNVQPDTTPTYQNQFVNENNTFDHFADRTTSTNSQSQPNSGKLKWPSNETEEQEDKFPGQQYDQTREIPRYEPGQNEEYEEGHFIHKFLNDAFPTSWNNQELGFPKRKTQALQLNSPAFNDPNQHLKQPPMQQNPQYWQQGPPNNNPNMQHNVPMDNNAPPGLLNFYPGQNKPSMQEPRQMPGDRMIRMTGSLTNIPLRQNPQGPSTLSRHATLNDLPNTSPMNSGPMNPGLMPRFATFNELPKTSNMLKPNLTHFGSVTNLPNTSNLGGFGMGGMNQGLGMNQNMNQQMHQGPPQLNKPMLNFRIGSTPELPLMSEISKFKLDNMSTQSIRDLIERDILLRLMMNQIQSNENEILQQNVINDLNDIKKFSPALSGLGNIDYNNLGQMNKGALDNIYQELSALLGKSVENNKECAVLYVKGLEHKDIKVRMLYNIFSNFGNIKKIIFIRRQAAALIEYETVEYAAKAKEDLSNIVFMGKPLRIYYSFHPIINLKSKKNGKEASEEIWIGAPKTFRFGKTKNLSMNPPSATLHISNLTKEVCNEEVMRNFFGPYGRIEAIQIKCMENNRNMCLIRMASMEESLNVMAYLHDMDLGGRPVQISFTKSKI